MRRIILVLVVFVPNMLLSQVIVYGGAAIPVADFGDKDFEDYNAIGAATGFNAGLLFNFPLYKTNLGIYTGLDVSFNSLSNEFEEKRDKYFEQFRITNITHEHFTNIPLSTGVSYIFTINKNLNFLTSLGATFNFLRISDFEFEYARSTITVSYDNSYNLGFKLGGGLIINDVFLFNIQYLNLGEHDFEVSTTTYGGFELNQMGEIRVDLLTLTLGFIM